MKITVGKTTWPVDPKFNPVCGMNEEGTPVALRLGAGGGLKAEVEGTATEETLGALKAKAFGEGGHDYITDTSEHTGDWYGLTALEDVVISSVTTPDGIHASMPIPLGMTIPLSITKITLASGKLIAWKA